MHTVLQVHRPGEGGPMQSSCWHPNGGQAMEGHTARELATVYPPCCPPSPQPTCATTGQCRGALITQGGQTWQGDTPAVASVADRPPEPGGCAGQPGPCACGWLTCTRSPSLTHLLLSVYGAPPSSAHCDLGDRPFTGRSTAV